MATIFITGIDTDVGKSFATGLLARYLHRAGRSVMTQKISQTGCQEVSEDILLHRQLMGIDLTDADREGLTCPYLFQLPASPHLAAAQEGRQIDPARISQATTQLEERYGNVLLEGVGGLYVPLNDSVTVLEYLEQKRYPVVLVSSAKLGSINHTLLSLEALKRRELDVLGIIYNEYPPENPTIAADSQQIFRRWLTRFGYRDTLISIPKIDLEAPIPDIDFSELLPIPKHV